MRRSRFVRRAAAAAVAALALATITACSDDGSSAEPSAAESSPSEPEVSASTGETIDPSAFVDGVLGNLVDATTAHLDVDATGPLDLEAAGDVDYSTTPPSMAMSLSSARLGEGTVEMRLVDGLLYLALPQVGSGKFVEIDLSSPSNPFGADLTDLMDPSKALEAIKDDVTRVTYVGDQEVDGETLHHYSMTVRSEAVRDLGEQLGATGRLDVPSVIDFDLWTDDNGMVRQTRVGLGDAGTATVKISDWGEPVDIEPPLPDEVVQLPDGLPSSR